MAQKAESNGDPGFLDELNAVAPKVPIGDDDFLAELNAVAPKAPEEGGPQNNSAFRLPLMAGHALATGTQNMLGLPGTVSGLVDDLSGKKDFKPRNALEATLQKIQSAVSLPTGRQIAKFTGLGLENHPELTPQNDLERYGTAAIEALPNAAAIMLSGGSAIPALAIAGTGGVAAEAAHQWQPDNKWLPIVAGTVASLGAGGLTATAERALAASAATKNLAKAEQALAEAHEAAFAGRDPALRSKPMKQANDLEAAQDAATQGKFDAGTAAGKIKSASQANLEATEKLAGQFTGQAEKEAQVVFDGVAGQAGKATTVQKAGEVLQDEARLWRTKTMPKKLGEVSKPLDAAVPGDTQTPIFGFSKALDQITESGGKLQVLISELTPKLPARLKSLLEDALDSPAGKAGVEPAPVVSKSLLDANGQPMVTGMSPAKAPSPLTWEEVRKLRSALGDALSNPKIVNDIGEQNLQHLYAAVTQDLGATAVERGAGELFNTYNDVSTRLYNLAAGPMSRIISSTNKALEKITPEDAAKSFLAGGKDGGTALAALRGEIPKGVDELAAAQLHQGGVKGWAGLAEEGRAALVPDSAKSTALTKAAGLKEQAEQNAKQVIETARKDHTDNVNAADEGKRTGNFSLSQKVRAAQKAKAQASAEAAQKARETAYANDKRVRESTQAAVKARAAAPQPTNPLMPLINGVQSLVGAGLGYGAAPSILDHLGLTTAMGPAGPFLVAAGGMAAPALVRGAKSLVKNPGNAMVPVTGAMAGDNALAPTRAKARK